jgi:hypothetical protein
MFARVGHKYGNAAVYDPSVLSSAPLKLVLGRSAAGAAVFTLWKYWPEERKNQNGIRYSVVERMVTDVTCLRRWWFEREIILDHHLQYLPRADANFCSACFSGIYCCATIRI